MAWRFKEIIVLISIIETMLK